MVGTCIGPSGSNGGKYGAEVVVGAAGADIDPADGVIKAGNASIADTSCGSKTADADPKTTPNAVAMAFRRPLLFTVGGSGDTSPHTDVVRNDRKPLTTDMARTRRRGNTDGTMVVFAVVVLTNAVVLGVMFATVAMESSSGLCCRRRRVDLCESSISLFAC